MDTQQAPLTRAAAIAWAREIVGDPEVVYLDTETTGLGSSARICDIAIVAQDGTVLFDSLINPGEPIPAVASKVHGITDEMVTDAPAWAEVEANLEGLLDQRTVIIYNVGYDEPIIQQHQKAIDSSPIVADYRCAMLAYSDFDGSVGNYGSLKWHKLDAAAARFGIAPGGHRALADAETTRQVVHAMAREGGPLNAGTFVELEPDIEELFGSSPAEPEPPAPQRAPSIEDLFILYQVETRKKEEAESRIADLRARILEWMATGDLQATESFSTGAPARIDQVTTLVITNR